MRTHAYMYLFSYKYMAVYMDRKAGHLDLLFRTISKALHSLQNKPSCLADLKKSN